MNSNWSQSLLRRAASVISSGKTGGGMNVITYNFSGVTGTTDRSLSTTGISHLSMRDPLCTRHKGWSDRRFPILTLEDYELEAKAGGRSL